MNQWSRINWGSVLNLNSPRLLANTRAHFQTKTRAYFQGKDKKLKKWWLNMSAIYSVHQVHLASYYITWWTARQKKLHTKYEELVKLWALAMVHMTKEDGTAKKTEHTLLSSNTFHARNYAVQDFIKQQVDCSHENKRSVYFSAGWDNWCDDPWLICAYIVQG